MKGLYRGFGLSVAGVVPYRAVYFGMYGSLTAAAPFGRPSGITGLAVQYMLAQITVITAAYVSYPLDTVHRRLQMQGEKPSSEWIYRGPIHCLRMVWREEGMAGVFKGAGGNAFRSLGSALTLVIYGEMQSLTHSLMSHSSYSSQW